MAKIKTLRSHHLFASLADRELALFSRIVTEESFGTGTVLFAEKMRSAAFYLVQKGKVEVTSSSFPSRDLALGEGSTFGEWALLGPDHLCAVSARVGEDSSLLVVRRADFENFLQEEPGIALKVVRAVLAGVWEDLSWLRDQVEQG